MEKQFVSDDIREGVPGITSSVGSKASQAYWSSQPYAYPLFKIHRVKPEDLVPGVRPPIRLVTAQRNGATSRSDKYLMLKILQDVQNEYCTDLVKDSTDALIWFDGWFPMSESQPFALDVVALYDSINPSLANEALDCALKQCSAMNTWTGWRTLSNIPYVITSLCIRVTGIWPRSAFLQGGYCHRCLLTLQWHTFLMTYCLTRRMMSTPIPGVSRRRAWSTIL